MDITIKITTVIQRIIQVLPSILHIHIHTAQKVNYILNFFIISNCVQYFAKLFFEWSKIFYRFIGYGISSSYSSSLTSSGVRDASSLSGLNSSNGTIGRDVIAPSDAVTSLSSQKGKDSELLLFQDSYALSNNHKYCLPIISLIFPWF